MFHNNNKLTYDSTNSTENEIINKKQMEYTIYKKDFSTNDVHSIALSQPNIKPSCVIKLIKVILITYQNLENTEMNIFIVNG